MGYSNLATDSNERKSRIGKVVSDKMQKTVVVAIERRVQHPVYGKMVRKTTRLKAHDEENSAKTGDTVRHMERRPTPKDKRWRVVGVGTGPGWGGGHGGRREATPGRRCDRAGHCPRYGCPA